MSDQILIRKIPGPLKRWIEDERRSRSLTQREFVIDMLEAARIGGRQQLLFNGTAAEKATTSRFTFIDLFAGIGGLRIGAQLVGGKCEFSSEWDKNAQRTYYRWFNETPHGDIREIKPREIPTHDVLLAGFPCQPFSIAGVSKKNSLGRSHGFQCKAQGNLFFDLVNVIQAKRPPVAVLENVKNLRSHDGGRTWRVIRASLEEDCGYWVFDKVLDASDFGVPQHRERVFIVCFDRDVFRERPPFEFPKPATERARLASILEEQPDPKYTLTEHLWTYLQNYAKRHAEKGNGFGFGMADLDGITRTLSARYYKDGSEILIPQGKRKSPRRLSPREAARLMGFNRDVAHRLGFSEELPIVVSDTQAYRQFGNAVVPLVAEAVMKEVVKVMHWHLESYGERSLIAGRARKKRRSNRSADAFAPC